MPHRLRWVTLLCETPSIQLIFPSTLPAPLVGHLPNASCSVLHAPFYMYDGERCVQKSARTLYLMRDLSYRLRWNGTLIMMRSCLRPSL